MENKHKTLPEILAYWTKHGNGHFNMYQYMRVVQAKKDLLENEENGKKKDSRKSKN